MSPRWGCVMFGKAKQIDALRGQVDELRQQATLWGDWSRSVSTYAGVDVDREKALSLLAVYGSVRMISDGISTMPVDVYRRKADGTSEGLVRPRWLEEPVLGVPFTEWCSQVLTSLLLDGNSYLVVTRNDSNQIVELIPLANDSVNVARHNGRKMYLVNGVEFGGELLHIKAMMLAGSDVGLSPVEYARQTIGLGLAAQKHGSEWFDGPGKMPGVIEAPRPMQPEIMTATAKAWQKFRRDGGQGLPGVLQDGMTFKPTGVTNEQAQFLQTRQWSAAEIAGQMFLLDPSDLGIPVTGTSLTYGNLVERDTRRVKVAYLPWMVRIEQAISALLFSPRFMKFNQDALLRGDLKSQYEAFNIALGGAPFLEVDEVRETLDRGPMTVVEAPVVEPVQENSVLTPEEERARYMISPNFTINLPEDMRLDVPAPVVNVTVPDAAAPVVNVTVPEARAPVVNVTVPEQERVDIPAPQVTVEQAAPRTVTRRVIRDANGLIERIIEEVAQ